MTVNELRELIEQRRKYRVDTMQVEVSIIDVKEAYGNIRVRIMPVSGDGSKWVNLDTLAAWS